MESDRDQRSSEENELLHQALKGDPQALNVIFEQHQQRLLRMVQMRLD